MLSAVDEVINVLLLSLEATFSCLFCFHSGTPFCAHGKLSHRKQKLIVSSLSAPTSLYSYPFVWPVFSFFVGHCCRTEDTCLGFPMMHCIYPSGELSCFQLTTMFLPNPKQTCLVASALLLDMYWFWGQRSWKSLIIFFYLLRPTKISVAQY